MFKLRDPVNGLTHLIGALLSIIALTFLVYDASLYGKVWHVVSFAIFGSSLILLYSASALYHLLPVSEKGQRILRRIDHMMIFVLIAGTYTPVCLIPLRGPWGWSLLVGIWVLAVTGIVLKAVWMQAPRWFSTMLYLVMGWLALVAFWPLMHTLPMAGIAWLVLGGIFYSIGAIFYGTKWPNIIPGWFGFHEIFHLFVMAGSFSHFWLMAKYILFIN